MLLVRRSIPTEIEEPHNPKNSIRPRGPESLLYKPLSKLLKTGLYRGLIWGINYIGYSGGYYEFRL